MAFGKDENLKRHVDSFRQQSSQSMRSARKTGRKGPPYFVDMYRCSTMDTDMIRLVRDDYPQDLVVADGENLSLKQVFRPYIEFVEHFDGYMEKGAICSAGPWANFKDKRKQCYGCDIFWDTAVRNDAGRIESTRISKQNKYAFSVFDYGVYHKMEQIDRDTGNVRVNPNSGKPYTNWVKCQGQGCDACRAQKETKLGNMSHWPINWTQMEVLRSATLDIGKSCSTCGTIDSIQSVGWMCKACGECVIDMANTTLKMDELLKLTDNYVQCPYCKHTGFLEELIHCQACSERGSSGVRAGLFDVDLKVKAVELANGNKSLQIMGWSQPHPAAQQFAKDMKPIDLLNRYAPDTLEFQAQRFGITTQTQAQPGQQATQAPQGQPQPAPQQPTQGYVPPSAPVRQYVVPYNKPQ